MKNVVKYLTCISLMGFSIAIQAQHTTIDFSTLPAYASVPTAFESDAVNTPNIGVSYADVSVGGVKALSYLDTYPYYGNLASAAYSPYNGYNAQIILTPQAGYSVTLSSFALASYYDTTVYDQTVEVLNGIGQVLWTDGTAGNLTVYTSLSTHDVLTPDITSSGPLILQYGSDYDLGADDVVFSQSLTSAPDSGSSFAMLLITVAVLLGFGVRLKTA